MLERLNIRQEAAIKEWITQENKWEGNELIDPARSMGELQGGIGIANAQKVLDIKRKLVRIEKDLAIEKIIADLRASVSNEKIKTHHYDVHGAKIATSRVARAKANEILEKIAKDERENRISIRLGLKKYLYLKQLREEELGNWISIRGDD